jgi:hypothetical protein
VRGTNEGHLKSIREHDSKEVALIRNDRSCDPAEVKAAITKVVVEPPFEELVSAIRKGEK